MKQTPSLDKNRPPMMKFNLLCISNNSCFTKKSTFKTSFSFGSVKQPKTDTTKFQVTVKLKFNEKIIEKKSNNL